MIGWMNMLRKDIQKTSNISECGEEKSIFVILFRVGIEYLYSYSSIFTGMIYHTPDFIKK